MKVRNRKKVDATFNMASMTDIVFLLLIFFIVLSVFVTPRSVGVDLPKADGQPTTAGAIVSVSMLKGGNFSVEGKQASQQGVLEVLASKAKGEEYPSVMLYLDESVSAGDYVPFFAEIKKLGYRKIALGTDPKDEQ